MEVAVDREDCSCGFIKVPKIMKLDTITICLKDCIRKNDQCRKAICFLCRKADPMKYATNGVSTWMKNVQFFSHVQGEVEQLLSYKIPETEL